MIALTPADTDLSAVKIDPWYSERAMRIRSKLLTAFGVVLIIIVIGGGLSLFQVRSLYEAGRNLGIIGARNVDAAMEAKNLLTEAHLWLEEVLSGAEDPGQMAAIERRIEDAGWYLSAMLEGGTNEENTFFAVPKEQIELRRALTDAGRQVEELHQLAVLRFETAIETGTFDQDLDDQFDRGYETLIATVDRVEELVKEQMVISESTMTRVAMTGQLAIVFSTLIGLIAAIILSLFVSGQFSRRITMIAHLSEEVAAGNLTETLDVTDTDEIGDMAGSLDSIVTSLGTTLREVQHTGRTLNETTADLASNMEETAASVSEITGHIEGIKQRIIDQAASVEESSASIEEVVRNIESLNNQITNQSSVVNESSAAIEEMVGNIQSITRNIGKMEERFQELQRAATTGREMLNRTDSTVREISEQSEALLDTNKVISGIAAQTNLLAMNAAIEAAHAGDAGRGFAVVAGEIRSLAEDTAQKSRDVDTFLKTLKHQIETMVNASAQSQHSFKEVENSITSVAALSTEVRYSMEEQSTGSTQVLQALTQINGITEEVKNGSDEMKTGSNTVLNEMLRLAESSTEVTGSITEILHGIEEINSAVRHVTGISDRNKVLAAGLEERVAFFRLKESESDHDPEAEA